MKEIKDIAMWEETDSELAKYNLQQLLKTYDDLEEQYKSLMKQIIEQDKRIDKAIEYCEDITSREIDISDTDYDLGEDFTARNILKILRGKDNENNS